MRLVYNGVDLDTLNLEITSANIPLTPPIELGAASDPNIPGDIHLGYSYGPREFTIEGVIVCQAGFERQALKAVIEVFRQRTPKILYLDSDETKGLFCILNGKIEDSLTMGYVTVSIPMIAPDPFWYSVEEHVTTSVGTIVNAGNVPVRPVVFLKGPCENPTLTINEEEIGYTGSLSELDVVKFFEHTVTFNDSSALSKSTKVLPMLKSGDNVLKDLIGTLELRWRDCWLY
jgi:phage-related protein